MKFEEPNVKIVKRSDLPTCMIYFLIEKGEVVYVGQTKVGLVRPLHHSDKEFDTYAFMNCVEKDLDSMENFYIQKYVPKYNKMFNTNVCKTVLSLKVLFRNQYGYRFQALDIRRMISFLGIKSHKFMNKEYIDLEDISKMKKFIEENKENFLVLEDGSTACVIPKTIFSKKVAKK